MEHFTPKYRRNPNEKIHSLYTGIVSGNRTVTKVVRVSQDQNRLEAERTYGPSLPRGESGRIGVFVIGGLETTLDEMEYILEAKRQKPFVQRRSGGEIADMCRTLIERRNGMIKYFRKNPSEAPKKKRTARLYLPSGYRYVPTSEPGLQVLARV